MAETMALDPESTPLAVVHQAYYAMFHAALAAILLTVRSPPKKHASVVGQFGLLVKDLGPSLRLAASTLREMKDLRIEADYEVSSNVTAEKARKAVRDAKDFLRLCDQEFGFSLDERSSNG